jgi:hypothetical protein
LRVTPEAVETLDASGAPTALFTQDDADDIGARDGHGR